MFDNEPITYNPGIKGFIKATRHRSGSALVMTKRSEARYDLIVVFWAKSLHHAARPVQPYHFGVVTPKDMALANQVYDVLLSCGPPPAAIRDFQRELLYQWEEDIIYRRYRVLSWTNCERFAAHVWRQVGNGSHLELTYGRRSLDAYASKGTIHLPPHDKAFFWRKPVVLHEIAHEISPGAQHGPRFLGNYIDLCVRFLGLDRQNLTTTATEYGLQL